MKGKLVRFIVIALVALAVLASACALCLTLSLGTDIALAKSDKGFVRAAVSNLEGNEFAGASAIAVCEKDGSREFLIPESYYIQIVSVVGKGDYCELTYAGETFFIEMNPAIVPVDETFAEDEKIYPDVTLTLADDVELSSLEGVDDDLKKLDSSYQIKFLGYGQDFELTNIVYIMAIPADGKTLFGFIPASAFEPFNVPYQARAQAERDELIAQKNQLKPAPSPGDLPAPEGSVALKIILILGISLPAIIIIILLFVPSRRSSYVRKTRGPSPDGRDYDNPSDPYDRVPDRRRYDAGRRYEPPQSYPPQDYPQGGYPQGPYPQDRQGGYPQDRRGYDPRMDREVRGYDPNNYDDRR